MHRQRGLHRAAPHGVDKVSRGTLIDSRNTKLASANLLGACALGFVAYRAVRWGVALIAVSSETYQEMTSQRGKDAVAGGWGLIVVAFAVGAVAAFLAICAAVNTVYLIKPGPRRRSPRS